MSEKREDVPSRDSYIDAVFGAQGILSRVFAGYSPRPGQVALARAVDRAIAQRGHLLAEGPTGTGKSLAYAVPATYYAATEGKKVVIVTANIALQEQIVEKDLPFLKKILPWDFSYALMKGRHHHLCLDRLQDYELQSKSLFNGGRDHGGANAEERRQLPIVYEWARASATAGCQLETGDVSELPFEPLHNVWKKFSVSSDECKRQRCKHKNACFPNRARELARQSLVVVTNYHLLCANIGMYLEKGQDYILPPFHVAILDEAHKTADIARDAFGSSITLEALRKIARPLQDDDPRLVDDHDRACSMFFATMGAIKRNKERYKARIRGGFSADEIACWETLRASIDRVLSIYRVNVPNLQAQLEAIVSRGGADSHQHKRAAQLVDEQEKAQTKAAKYLDSLTKAMSPPQKGDREVFFIDEDDKGRITVASRLMYASDFLKPGLFEHTAPVGEDEELPDDAQPDADGAPCVRTAVIATSATLAVDGGKFGFAASELGVPAGYEELVAESPFDWKNQCLFVVPEGMPEPNSLDFPDAVAKMTEKIIKQAKGRTLGLFTSRRVLNHVYDAIVPTVGRQYTILKQGDASKMKLIERFKSDVSSVLLGNESFWAGVDVPGEALSCVIIDRLPFPTPDDPVLDALSAQDDRWFFKHSVPRAIIAFKQGAGRGVRSVSDKCVVVCLDRRLIDKSYGKQFLKALPADLPKSMRLDAIGEFLKTVDPFDMGDNDDDDLAVGENAQLPFGDAAEDEIPF
jgi:ATP-dependent DNA helicase DinG